MAADLRRRSAPHSTVRRLVLNVLPPTVHTFLLSQSEAGLPHLIFRALFGALSGAGLFLGIAHSLPLTFDPMLTAGCLFVALCAVGGALSSSFRCSVLLMFPSMLGSRGRAYLMLLVLSVLYKGPISNIQRNAEAAALSLSCNLDLQVRHSRLLWREAVRPFRHITQELMDGRSEFLSEALSVSRKFQSLRDRVVSQYGYKPFKGGNSTQEQFAAKTRMQCDSVVGEGVQRCADWFSHRWAECMTAIPVPIINHILCVPMTFDFLCDVMRVMTPWCRDQIPVEGNFGQLFDQLNDSVNLLSREFSTEVVLQEEQQDLFVLDLDFTEAVRGSLQTLMTKAAQLLNIVQLLLSFTFIAIFSRAFSYLRSYKSDILFDNVYITTYFKQIDSRRRTAGKRFLLPLQPSEKKNFIDPRSPKIHPEELRGVVSGLFQVLSVSLLCVVLLAVDFSLFHVLDIISKHTVTQFNLTGAHQVDIRVDGDSMMARLLRVTISAFNSSSSVNIHSNNQECVSPPSSLSAGVYVSCVCCVLLAALLSCLQVYTNRLHRVIAAFYHPKREKKRVLFLYNLQIHRRISTTDTQCIINQGGSLSEHVGAPPVSSA